MRGSSHAARGPRMTERTVRDEIVDVLAETLVTMRLRELRPADAPPEPQLPVGRRRRRAK